MYELNYSEGCEVFTTLVDAMSRARSLYGIALIEISHNGHTIAVYANGRLIQQVP